MIDYSDIEAKLEEYSNAFDHYISFGEFPSSIPGDDCLVAYMKDVIDRNPQIDGSDETWLEVMKEGLLSYFYQLLKIFQSIQQRTEEELKYIDKFERSDIDGKRKMWGEVYRHIKERYSKFEVNIDGFSSQFSTESREAVFNALINDWRNACRESNDREQEGVLKFNSNKWERSMIVIGNQDYEERRRVADMIYRSPGLSEIIEIIGRAKESHEEKDNIIEAYTPKGIKTGLPSEEIDRVETGDDLHRTLVGEFAMPDDMFYKKYVAKELLLLSPLRQRKPKKTELNRPKPRLKKGPIIVAVDTSGSMRGRPEEMAKSLLIQLVRMARRDLRSCYLITFSVRVKTIDLGRSGNILKMRKFLNERFTGGNGEEMLIKEVLKILETNEYEMADVLIIPDFIFNPPTTADIERVASAKKRHSILWSSDRIRLQGIRFYLG